LLFGLETLRPSFPELEHFSLLLRELHDMAALALMLHARELVSRLGGLRLRDISRRCVRRANFCVVRVFSPRTRHATILHGCLRHSSLPACPGFRLGRKKWSPDLSGRQKNCSLVGLCCSVSLMLTGVARGNTDLSQPNFFQNRINTGWLYPDANTVLPGPGTLIPSHAG